MYEIRKLIPILAYQAEFSTISEWIPIVDLMGGVRNPPIYPSETAKKAPKTQRYAVVISTFPKERAIGI